MKIIAISDTHMLHDRIDLPKGDLLMWYGEHKTNCAWMENWAGPCTCGYKETFAQYYKEFPK